MPKALMIALERGIVDLVQFTFGRRPLLTEEKMQRLLLHRFDWDMERMNIWFKERA